MLSISKASGTTPGALTCTQFHLGHSHGRRYVCVVPSLACTELVTKVWEGTQGAGCDLEIDLSDPSSLARSPNQLLSPAATALLSLHLPRRSQAGYCSPGSRGAFLSSHLLWFTDHRADRSSLYSILITFPASFLPSILLLLVLFPLSLVLSFPERIKSKHSKCHRRPSMTTVPAPPPPWTAIPRLGLPHLLVSTWGTFCDGDRSSYSWSCAL